MNAVDWRWKINEAVDRVRTRYDHIGRITGAPFLAVVYPPEAELAVLKEWHMLTDSLKPDFDIRVVDALEVTERALEEVGIDEVVATLKEPMPGSCPETELGHLWVQALAAEVKTCLSKPETGKPFASIERLAALYPATGPKSVMQELWDSAQAVLDGPVIVLIPGAIEEPRTYSFLGKMKEFMYRGDLL